WLDWWPFFHAMHHLVQEDTLMQQRLSLYRYGAIVVLVWLVLVWTRAPAQTPAPTGGQQPTALAYAAPAVSKKVRSQHPLPPPIPPAQPRTGGVLHFTTGVLRSFDPTVGYTAELALVWDTLLEWESTWYFPEAQTKPLIRKSLAESWDMVDPSTWVFHLRKGVKFHNLPPVNGREMTAEDVRYSYELLKGKPGYSNRTAVIKEVQVLDPYTGRLHLNLPDPNFPLNHVNAFSPLVLPREAVEAEGGLDKHPIGTGAFMLKEF